MSAYGEDFKKENGSGKKAAVSCAGATISFIVIPIIIIVLMEYLIDQIPADSGMNLDGFAVSIEEIMKLCIIFSLPLIILRTLYGFYPPGNYARFTFGALICVYGAAWLYIILSGGQVSVDISDMLRSAITSDTVMIDEVTFVLDIFLLMIILMIIRLLKIIVFYAEFRGDRNAYLNGENTWLKKKKRKAAAESVGPDNLPERHAPK